MRVGEHGPLGASIPGRSVHSILLTLMTRMSTCHLLKLCAAKRLIRFLNRLGHLACGEMEGMEKD